MTTLKKIALVTCYFQHNYGSQLQAYATQLLFDKLGLEKELCMKMMKLGRAQKIRSIIVHKVVPMYMIFGDKIMLL